jgi:hypothetical protein
MNYLYKIIYSDEYAPDLTEVNELAKEGWEVVQIGQAKFTETKHQWFYLLRQKATAAPQPA